MQPFFVLTRTPYVKVVSKERYPRNHGVPVGFLLNHPQTVYPKHTHTHTYKYKQTRKHKLRNTETQKHKNTHRRAEIAPEHASYSRPAIAEALMVWYLTSASGWHCCQAPVGLPIFPFTPGGNSLKWKPNGAPKNKSDAQWPGEKKSIFFFGWLS